MNDALENCESVSALADGQLRGDEFARAVQLAAHDAQAQAAWRTYHLIGDVLRSGELAACGRDAAFVQRFQARLQREPLPAAAMPAIAEAAPESRPVSRPAPVAEAANESSFRWKLVAGFASLAAVAAIGWNSAGSLMRPEVPTLALAPLPAAPAQQPVALASNDPQAQVMIRDPRLDELLAAHKQLGGMSVLQMPASFLRNATFDGPAR
ncbi:sigma-E factor negative regulatory protein [Variovorax terrae]|uniref:Sigma-E factor negative regulatory protein n=1 Tax=Variovorax terrae TaxID=2923278 RepID=A0A9X2ANZ4_9BURK|nr:sigma-E factor negative regulatory protein [Variovorax terrae]MCJ0764300.1 sigma-E factor negative regulatory protein [Variovorax terrae]